jgi:hypothetical protein
MVAGVNEAAITPTSPSRILITYFPQCAAPVSDLNLMHAHSSSVASMLSYLARIFGFWPFSVGHPDREF